jgi:hypothetical protein
MTAQTQYEDPCEIDSKPCMWIVEEWEDQDGSYCWDTYCDKCYRYRDWSKEELVI